MRRFKLDLYLQSFFYLTLTAVCFGQSARPETAHRIDLNVPVEGRIDAGKAHEFTLRLESRQIAVLVLEQKGVDLTLAVDVAQPASGSRRLIEMNAYDSLFGSERVLVKSENEPQDLLIRVFSPAKKAGAFSLTLAELKTSDERDALRIAAHRTVLEAQKFFNENKAESKQKGRALLENALTPARQSGDTILEKDILVALQSVSFHLGDYSKTIEYGQAALNLLANRAGVYERILLRTVIGISQISRNETRMGIDILSETVSEAQKLGDTSLQLAGLIFISQGYQKLGDLEKSLAYAEQANRGAEQADNISYRVDALRAISRIHFVRADFLRSVETINQAVEIIDQALASAENTKNDPEFFSYRNSKYTSYYDLALALISLGQRQKALDILQESLLFYRGTSGNKWNEAAILQLISSVYSSLGQNARSLEYSRQAADIYGDFGYKSGLIGLAQTRAANYRQLGDYEKEKQAYLDLLKAAGEDGPTEVIAEAYLKLGGAEKRVGHYAAALEYYLKSRQVSGDSGNKMLRTLAGSGIADAYILVGQFEKAAEVSLEVINAARSTGDRVTESNALYNLARVRRRQNDLTEALALIENSLEITESLRAELIVQESRAGYFSTVRDKYDFYIELLIELGKQPENDKFGAAAFAASERARARSLLDLLAESYTNVSEGIRPELKSREVTIGAKISSLQTRLIRLKSAEKPDAARIESVQKEIDRADDERERLESEIRRTNPRYADLKYPTPLDLPQTQKLLDDKTVLLEYQTGANASFLFAVGKNDFRIARLPSEQALRKSVETLRRGVSQPSRIGLANYLVTARELYQTLLSPVADLLKDKTKIIVAADGALNYLPFEALLTSNANSSLGKLPYLVRDFEISYTPSASVLANLNNSKNASSAEPQKDFLAFAAPDYGAKTVERQQLVSRTTRAVFGENRAWNLTDLPNARREAERIAGLFPRERATIFTGGEATEERAKTNELLGQYRYLHFAVHGLIDEELPQFSSLVLSLPKPAARIVNREPDAGKLKAERRAPSAGEDGLLQTPEIFNLRLRADLVTLSACETGLGQNMRGEGIVGLTRAFFYAGTPSLLVSLWKVDDASTAELMTLFYEQLRKTGGREKAGALREAQLKMIGADRYAHPYYWASFVLQGRRDGGRAAFE